MKFEKKSLAEIAGMSAEDQEKYMAAKETHDTEVREKALKAALEPLGVSVKTIEDAQKATSTDIDAIKETVKSIEEAQKSKITPELKNFLHSIVKERHQEFIDAFKNEGDLKIVVTKVAAMHMTNNGTVSNISGLTAYPTGLFEIDNEIAYIRVPENFILNVIRNSQRAKVPNQIISRQQVATEGAVAVVVEGAVKPLLQYKFQNVSTSRKKYAGRIEWTEEFEMDFEALLDAIITLFERDVITAWQDGIIDVIDANATAYVSSSLDGTLPLPDNGLAVIAAAQQIRVLGGVPDYVLMNPVDIDSAVYTQDTEGNFQLKPYIDASGNRIAGLTVVPSLKIDAGTALVGEFGIYKEIHSGFIMRRGQYNAQFIENEYTLIGEVFSVLQVAPANLPFVVKINLATVKAALQLYPTT